MLRSMSGEDEQAGGGESWLTRLSVDEWLAAAQGELQRATHALFHKQQRAGVTQARRAAGMAWNAALLGIVDVDERARYGRSYMDHLRALADDAALSSAVRDAATALVKAPLEQRLVQLGVEGDITLAKAAGVILEEATRRARGPLVS
jgi:hypothetical protein